MTETASWARRALALVVDWVASTLVVVLVIGPAGWLEDRASGFYVMGVFAAAVDRPHRRRRRLLRQAGDAAPGGP